MFKEINGQTYIVYTFAEYKNICCLVEETDALTGEVLTDDRLVIPFATNVRECTAVENVERGEDGEYVACECCNYLIVISDDDFYELSEGEYVCDDCAHHNDNYAICSVCGECFRVSEADMHETIDGDIICDDCFSYDGYTICEDCGRAFRQDDQSYVCDAWGEGIEVEICPNCIENAHGYVYCEDVGMWCDEDDTVEVHRQWDTIRSPQNYADDNYYHCEECGRWVNWPQWDDEAECCCNCRESRRDIIHSYHHHTRYQFTKFNKDGAIADNAPAKKEDELLIGLELEVERASSESTSRQRMAELVADLLGDRVYFENDCSLDDGFEIIFNPHTPEALFALPLKELLDLLTENGYRSHDGGHCGLHIHTSAEWYGDTDDEKLDNAAKVLHMYTVNWDFLVPCSRRAYFGYCQLHPFSSYEDARNHWSWAEGHGTAINTYGLFNGTKTLEFRLGRGTLSFASFTAWVDMHLAIVRNVKSIAPEDTDIAKWFSGVSYDTARYIFKKTGVWVPTSAKKERRA